MIFVVCGLRDADFDVAMNMREAFEQIARVALGFVELAGTDEVDGGVGCDRGLVLDGGEFRDRRSGPVMWCGFRPSRSTGMEQHPRRL